MADEPGNWEIEPDLIEVDEDETVTEKTVLYDLLGAASLFDGIEIPQETLKRTSNKLQVAEMLHGFISGSGDASHAVRKIELSRMLASMTENGWQLIERTILPRQPFYELQIEDPETFKNELSITPEYQRKPWERQGNYWIVGKQFQPFEHSVIRGLRVEMHTDPENHSSGLTANVAIRGNAFNDDVDSLLKLVDLKSLVENYPLLGTEIPGKKYKLDSGGTGVIYEIPELGTLRVELTAEGVSIISRMDQKFEDDDDQANKDKYLSNAISAQMDIAGNVVPGFIGQLSQRLSSLDDLPTIEFKPIINAPEKEGSLLARFKKSQDEFVTKVPDILRDPRHVELYRAIAAPPPEINFDMVGGLDNEVKRMRRSLNKAHNPDAYKKAGLKPKATVLLAGPPGCGKTMLAEAAAQQIDGIFLNARGSDIMSMWAGEAEKNVSALFDMAELLGRENKVVLFLDEIESIAPSRTGTYMMEFERKITAEFLGALNRNYPNCFIVAATNDPKHVDTAVLRSGRFNDIIMIGRPNAEGRKQILENWMDYYKQQSVVKLFVDDLDMESIVKATHDLSGSDLKTIVEAVIGDEVDDAIEENRDFKPVTSETVLKQIHEHRKQEEVRGGLYL